jgi:alkanesulfonate monooxygenase SsuD/methylene tetrahydromethanopterin reductase-like flavin-dependent oxidoreductase (luciferase family)
MIVDLQINPAAADWSLIVDAVRAAEEAGFGSVWNMDHFSGAHFGNQNMPECFSTLGAWASITSRIGLGSLVVNVMNREPGLLANAASTVQNISVGRLTLGIGAGASPNSPYAAEHRALNMNLLPTMAQRHARLVEVMDIAHDIWSVNRAEKYDGFPIPCAVPPVIVGVNSRALATIAGRRYAGINVRFNHDDRVGIINAAKESYIQAHGSLSGFDASIWIHHRPELADPAHPEHVQYANEGFTRIILLSLKTPDLAAISSTAKYLYPLRHCWGL